MSIKERTVPKPREPAFADETEERAYWEQTDSADEIDWPKAERVLLPNLEPSKTSISLRLPTSLLERTRSPLIGATSPYQSLIKMWLAEKVDAAMPE